MPPVAAPQRSGAAPHPFDWLVGFERVLERRYPERIQRGDGWRGVLIDVAGVTVLVDMESLRELIDLPRLTRVPLAERWVLGLANLRGSVLPVFDLGALLASQAGTALPPRASLRHVLVTGAAGRPDGWVGFAIERYRGVRQCAPAQRQRDVDAPLLQAFAHGGFLVDGRVVPVLDIERLTDERERFLRPLRRSLVVGGSPQETGA